MYAKRNQKDMKKLIIALAAHVVEGFWGTGQMGDKAGGKFFILNLFVLSKF